MAAIGPKNIRVEIAKQLNDKVLPIVFGLAAWEGVTRAGIINQDFLPAFSSVIAAAYDLMASGSIGENLVVSLYRVGLALSLAVVVGVTIGMAMARFKKVDTFFNPIVTMAYPLPVPALIPLTMLLIGVNNMQKILITLVGCLPPLIINSFHGAQSVNRLLIWSARSLGTGENKMLRRIILPAALPYILNGIRIALAYAFVVLVSAEMVQSRKGVGRLIFLYGANGVYDFMFASILYFVAIGLIADRIYVALSKRATAWYESG